MNGDIKAQEAKELLKQYCDLNICEDCIFCNIGQDCYLAEHLPDVWED